MAKVIDVPGMGSVEFPDYMTDQEISSAIQRNMQGSIMNNAVPYSGKTEALRSAAGGATFGLNEEIEAALRSGAISGPQYEQIRDRLRAQQSQFKQDYPVSGAVTEVGGALAAPFGAFKALGRAGPVSYTHLTLPTKRIV